MAINSVKVTLQVRHDSSSNWNIRNPILAEGEYGLELDTFLIKIGDGIRDWAHLPYLNKLDPSYFKWQADGSLTFSDEFNNDIAALKAIAGQAITSLTVTEPPTKDTDVPNKKYVDDAILAANHLKREIVEQLPTSTEADENTLYMVLSASGTYYDEYMLINGAWDAVGTTGDAQFVLEVATDLKLGGVKSSEQPDYIKVQQDGVMTLNQVSTTKLYVPTGDTFIIYGGSA